MKTGLYKNKFVVVAKDGVSANASIETFARRPQLKLNLSAPSMRFVGNVIKYNIKVSNIGDGNANNMQTKLQIPDATAFISANEGGKLEKGNTIVWETTSLQPKESKELVARVKAKEIRKVKAVAETSAFAAKPQEASVETSIEGIAALLLKVDDINDPVPVGETETYVIKVTNQGSLPATNIRISCDLEESMEFEKSNGPTKAAIAGAEGEGAAILMRKAGKVVKSSSISGELKKGKILVFEPLSSLAPGKEAVWQVVIKALKAGDFRFNVNVISDQLTRPVNENESTTFYND
jgi:uncharacterized repeat protein (TIGR01451 family)